MLYGVILCFCLFVCLLDCGGGGGTGLLGNWLVDCHCFFIFCFCFVKEETINAVCA